MYILNFIRIFDIIKQIKMNNKSLLVNELSKLQDSILKLNKDLLMHNDTYRSNYVNMKIEKGMLDNIENANDEQIKRLLDDSFKFKYYKEYNNKEVFKKFIISKKRSKKISKII